MKTIKFLGRMIIVLLCCYATTSCKKDKDEETKDFEIQENGLTRDINELIPEAILEAMEDLGMPINYGGNPPLDITGAYLVSPQILVASNIPDDLSHIGHQFNDQNLTLSEQNNNTLTIKVQTAQGETSGEGEGAYLVGSGSKFTIFCLITHQIDDEHTCKTVDVYSGEITSGGIKDFYSSFVMVEGGGSQWDLVEDGQGRLVRDENGMASRITTSKSAKSFIYSGESELPTKEQMPGSMSVLR